MTRRKMSSAGVALAPTMACLFLSSVSFADTLEVPAQYPTIQQAITASSNGDLIQVATGTYPGQINTSGKAITIEGAVDNAGSPTTVLEGSGSGSVITILSGESTSTILRNLEVRNGGGYPGGFTRGGGAYVSFNSRARFENCHFLDNAAQIGGGIYVAQGSEVVGCTFIGNTCTYEGFTFNGSAIVRGDATGWPLIIEDCYVTGNFNPRPDTWAVYAYMPDFLFVSGTTVCGNEAYECNGCSGSDNYVSDDCPIECDPGYEQISNNASQVIAQRGNRCECVKEWGSCGSDAGEWAVTYDLSQGATAGRPLTVRCIEYGSSNDSGIVAGRISLFRDTDGGAPLGAGSDLELIVEQDISIVDNMGSHVLVFDSPVEVPADTNLVVVLYGSFSYGYLSVAGNSAASSSETWYRDFQGFCSDVFRPVSELGYPNFNWVTQLNIEIGDLPCPADINNDGLVGGADLSQILGFWGTCLSGDCPPDLNGDGIVDGVDLSFVLGAWGSCP